VFLKKIIIKVIKKEFLKSTRNCTQRNERDINPFMRYFIRSSSATMNSIKHVTFVNDIRRFVLRTIYNTTQNARNCITTVTYSLFCKIKPWNYPKHNTQKMFSINSDFFVLIAFMLVQSLVLYLNTWRVENRITAELSAIKKSRRNSSANTESLQKINDLDRNISLMGYKVRDIKNGVGSRDSNSGSRRSG